jgi:hypothetical protein
MIGVQRTLKQKAGRFRKKIAEKLKNLLWHRKEKKFSNDNDNWDD